MALDFTVEQDGWELSTVDSYKTEAGSDYYMDIEPGETILCAAEFQLEDKTSPVSFLIMDWWTETDSMSFTLDPANLPGAPAGAR